jgi:hypothetical protein
MPTTNHIEIRVAIHVFSTRGAAVKVADRIHVDH